ncbi:hypothetical protein EJ08DRAFT_696025 [Tothia fuscella]|uniref:Uncharacterized protein n=1 Tax=Tothia fuscella TaxID=1048955 RepID=A0A9P4NTH4_9PEZI|nr:hypothetical protein EJ08DRAFT_696025 [Tothia fuscella]
MNASKTPKPNPTGNWADEMEEEDEIDYPATNMNDIQAGMEDMAVADPKALTSKPPKEQAIGISGSRWAINSNTTAIPMEIDTLKPNVSESESSNPIAITTAQSEEAAAPAMGLGASKWSTKTDPTTSAMNPAAPSFEPAKSEPPMPPASNAQPAVQKPKEVEQHPKASSTRGKAILPPAAVAILNANAATSSKFTTEPPASASSPKSAIPFDPSTVMTASKWATTGTAQTASTAVSNGKAAAEVQPVATSSKSVPDVAPVNAMAKSKWASTGSVVAAPNAITSADIAAVGQFMADQQWSVAKMREGEDGSRHTNAPAEASAADDGGSVLSHVVTPVPKAVVVAPHRPNTYSVAELHARTRAAPDLPPLDDPNPTKGKYRMMSGSKHAGKSHMSATTSKAMQQDNKIIDHGFPAGVPTGPKAIAKGSGSSSKAPMMGQGPAKVESVATHSLLNAATKSSGLDASKHSSNNGPESSDKAPPTGHGSSKAKSTTNPSATASATGSSGLAASKHSGHPGGSNSSAPTGDSGSSSSNPGSADNSGMYPGPNKNPYNKNKNPTKKPGSKGKAPLGCKPNAPGWKKDDFDPKPKGPGAATVGRSSLGASKWA